ncbi:MAG: M56 family metallopeptidase [Solirubrobacteraceae bacterium]
MTVALAAAVILGLALPHLLPLHRVKPTSAIALWLGALVLRAVSGIVIVILFILDFPASELFRLLTQWCWHAVLPFVRAHLGLSGHSLGDDATIIPAVAVTASTLSAGWALFAAARGVRVLLRRRTLGAGPMGSVIVGGPDVVVAAAGLARPKVIVSAGALTLLDDAELAASLEHERGHIARSHRFILACAAICRALGRLVPGGRIAVAELAFHVERDADAYALARAHDRTALASAIRKAAPLRSPTAALNHLADGRSVASRLRLLGDSAPRRRSRDLLVGGAVTVMAALALWLAVTTPALATAGMRTLAAQPVQKCPA